MSKLFLRRGLGTLTAIVSVFILMLCPSMAYADGQHTVHITHTNIDEGVVSNYLNEGSLADGFVVEHEIPVYMLNYYGEEGLSAQATLQKVSVNGTEVAIPENNKEKFTYDAIDGVDGEVTVERRGTLFKINFAHNELDAFGDSQIVYAVLSKDLDIEVVFEHTHSLDKVAEVPATCTEPGAEAYWKCSDSSCGKMFSDEAGENEITEPVVILAKGHSLQKTEAKAATTSAAGNSEYYTCTACGKFFSDAAGASEIAKDSWVIAKLEEKTQPTPGTSGDDKAAVSKAQGKIVIKAKSKKAVSIKAGKTLKVSKAVKVTKNVSKGKVTYKKVKGNKNITIKNGKIKVAKKGLKKGKTYTIKVKATAAATDKYEAATSKVIALKIKVG